MGNIELMSVSDFLRVDCVCADAPLPQGGTGRFPSTREYFPLGGGGGGGGYRPSRRTGGCTWNIFWLGPYP